MRVKMKLIDRILGCLERKVQKVFNSRVQEKEIREIARNLVECLEGVPGCRYTMRTSLSTPIFETDLQRELAHKLPGVRVSCYYLGGSRFEIVGIVDSEW